MLEHQTVGMKACLSVAKKVVVKVVLKAAMKAL
jgi:hypothetical protein